MVGTVPGPGCLCEPGGEAPLEGEIWVIASWGTRLPERVIELQLNCSSAGRYLLGVTLLTLPRARALFFGMLLSVRLR